MRLAVRLAVRFAVIMNLENFPHNICSREIYLWKPWPPEALNAVAVADAMDIFLWECYIFMPMTA